MCLNLPKRSLIGEPIASPYGKVAVYQFDDQVRALTLDGVVMSLVNLANPLDIPSPYIAAIAKRVRNDMAVLHLGVAGGTLAKYIEASVEQGTLKGIRQVGIELNAQVLQVARDYLDLPSSKHLKVRVTDACKEIANFKAASFDLIVLDLFDGAGNLPDFATEPQFLTQCLELLRSKGMLCINIMDAYGRAEKVAKLKGVLREVIHNISNDATSLELPSKPAQISVETLAKKAKRGELVNHLVWVKIET